LRLHLRSNDFTQWLSKELGLTDLARHVDQIDIYTNTLDGARTTILNLIDRDLAK
jgi:uncharacterized protein DUF5752